LAVGLVFACLVLMLACAPGTATNDDVGTNVDDTAVVGAALNWSENSDCSMCHVKSVNSLASLSCEAAQGEANSTCMTCHTDLSGIADAHSGVTTADTSGDQKRLKKTKIEESTCLSCHVQSDLIAATVDLTALTDSEGTTVNPHEVTTTYNTNGNHETFTCSSCHKLHSETPTTDTAYNFCLGCHHQAVFECNTCHE